MMTNKREHKQIRACMDGEEKKWHDFSDGGVMIGKIIILNYYFVWQKEKCFRRNMRYMSCVVAIIWAAQALICQVVSSE